MKRWLMTLVLVTGVVAETSHASTVRVVGDAGAVHYVAGPGERNELTFTAIEDSWPAAFLVTDPGATIAAGRGCVSVDAHSAACIARSGDMYHLRAELGDGDDILHPAGFDLVRANGGSGDDRLLGGTWDDRLDGGGGTDEIRGGEGSDVLRDGDSDDAAGPDILDGGPGRDWVSYDTRARSVRLDLSDPGPDGAAGEADTLVGIENLHGGRGDDHLIGDDGPNGFDDEGGTNEMVGMGGSDAFRGARAGDVDCGAGKDGVRNVGPRVFLERSCEEVRKVSGDGDFRVRPHPRVTASGMSMVLWCTGVDDIPFDCAGRVTITSRSQVLARGVIARGVERRVARIALTAAGERILARRDIVATVRIRGTGLPDLAWRTRLERRR